MQLSDFLNEVYIEAPGCPEALALTHLRHALREFCDRSHVWKAEADPVALMAGYREYDIDLPVDTELARNGILGANQGGEPVEVLTREELPIDWRQELPSDVITTIVPSRTSIMVFPTPETSGALPLTLDVALRPIMTAVACDDRLANWREGIVAGTVARLKVMRDKPWTDREGVPDYRNRFDEACDDAHAAVIKGHSSRVLRTQRWSRV